MKTINVKALKACISEFEAKSPLLPVTVRSTHEDMEDAGIRKVYFEKGRVVIETEDVLTAYRKAYGKKGGRPRKFKSDKERYAFHNARKAEQKRKRKAKAQKEREELGGL